MGDSLYRIIDANFNRAREALRGMEEYCRFLLDNKSFSAAAKQMRHELTAAIQRLDAARLLAARDTDADVGKDLTVAGQMTRATLADTFAAAAKRASEALRVLAETCQTVNPITAAECERLRFAVYALEKNVHLAAFKKDKLERICLYVLITVTADTQDNAALSLARQCLAGGADAIQLRAKQIADKRHLELAKQLVRLCRDAGALCLINDRIDIAVLSDADGAHLGQEDLPPKDARALEKKPLLLGGSTHNLQELHAAIDAGFDYVGVGPAFPSPTKPDIAPAGLTYLRQAAQTLADKSIKPIAIGGIEITNLRAVIETGIRAVAIGSAVCSNPLETCQTIKKILRDFCKPC